MSTVDHVIAKALVIDVTRVTDDLEYRSIREWDSLGHVALMVALEDAYGLAIDDELTLDLRSVAAIREFVAADRPDTPEPAAAAAPVTVAAAEPAAPSVHRGLDGITFDRTRITRIDGARGTLEYRGYSIHDLAEQARYTEVAHLLVNGALPDAAALEVFEKQLRTDSALPRPVLDLARTLADAHPLAVLRTCVSALGALSAPPGRLTDETYEQAHRAGLALIAQVPMIVAAHHAYRSGREPGAPDEGASFTEAFLTALLGERPAPSAVRLVDRAFIVHADHSANAATFTARVAVGCHARMHAALTAAIAAFGGSVHGGAAERVVGLIDEVGSPADAEAYVAGLRSRGEPVMGFGHRVYRTEDPRVRHLRATAAELAEESGDHRGLAVLDAVAAAMRPLDRHGVSPNVDLYAGLSYRLLGLPDDLAVPLFVVARTAGWVAQALEQHADNVLIRPLLHYVGPDSRPYPGSPS